jgi:hypothetical protein
MPNAESDSLERYRQQLDGSETARSHIGASVIETSDENSGG